jgi:hypothetical protein
MTSQWRSIPTSKTRTIETLQYRSIEKSVAQRREIALRTDFHVMRRGHSTLMNEIHDDPKLSPTSSGIRST